MDQELFSSSDQNFTSIDAELSSQDSINYTPAEPVLEPVNYSEDTQVASAMSPEQVDANQPNPDTVASDLWSFRESMNVQISTPLNLSTVNQLSDSIIDIPQYSDTPTTPDLILLKPGINLADNSIRFAVNTVSGNLLIRSATGQVKGSFSRGSELTYSGDYKVFEYNGQKTLMLKVANGTDEGYVAAPFLKIATPQSQPLPQPSVQPAVSASTMQPSSSPEPLPSTTVTDSAIQPALENPAIAPMPAALPETINPSLNRIRATSMDRVSGVGDSIGVGMHENGFSRISALGSRPTSGHLTEVQRLISTRQINSENTDSFILYGAGNNFPSREFNQENVDQAISDFTEMVEILLQAGIQPVVCTMFESMHGGRRPNTTQSDIDTHPRIRAIRMFNDAMRSLATEKGIPLIDMHTLTPQNPGYLIHPGNEFYTQMVDVIESSLNNQP